jgi:protein-disulfide isomerase
MRSIFLLTVVLPTLVAAAGCRRDDAALQKELSGIRQEVQAMRAQLSKMGAAPARQRPPGPDPSKVYAVGVDGAPSSGPADAPVTLVLAYEYACPWCDKQRQAFAEIAKAHGDDVRFVYRPFLVHPQVATEAARAACAADRQGRFAEVDAALWKDVFAARSFDRASVEKAAAGAGADMARLRADMDGACNAWIQGQQAALSALGAGGTPMVWINGRPAGGGFLTAAQLEPLVTEELARARERIAGGTPRAAYYAEWVMKKGLTRVGG